MDSTSHAVWLAIAIAVALVLLTRSGKFEAASYRRANWASAVAWIALILLGLWIARKIVMPILQGY